MSEETQIIESPKIKKIRQDLETWLNKETWSFDELRRWLKGYELPAVGYDEEPYTWILYSFPESKNYRQEMAKRIADFLGKKPYLKGSDKKDDKLFYNLFYLSAGLDCKNELGKPLSDIFKFFQENGNKRDEFFFSKNSQYYLINAFREALIRWNDAFSETLYTADNHSETDESVSQGVRLRKRRVKMKNAVGRVSRIGIGPETYHDAERFRAQSEIRARRKF